MSSFLRYFCVTFGGHATFEGGLTPVAYENGFLQFIYWTQVVDVSHGTLLRARVVHVLHGAHVSREREREREREKI